MDFGAWTLFFAGLGTFFTPCVLPLIPIYLAILIGAGTDEQKRTSAFLPGLAFVLGFSVIFILLGLGASAMGTLLTRHRPIMTLVAATLVLFFGLKFLGVIRIGFLEQDTRYQGDLPKSRFRTLNAFLMGFFFAFGWTPCVGPILGSVLSWTAVRAHSPLQGAFYLSIFSAGFALPMLLTALFTSRAKALFDRIKPRLPVIEKALGAIMILVALALVADVVAPLMTASSPAHFASAPDRSASSNQPDAGPHSARPMMIEFFSPTCPACRAVEPTVRKMITTCEGKNIDIILADVTQPQSRAKALRFGIRAIPTFVFLDESGKEVARLLGVQTETTFRNHLAVLLGQACTDLEPFPTGP